MKVLVHFDAFGTEAFGLWWVDQNTGLLRQVYLDDDSSEAARGKVIVYGKTNPDVTWSEWFDQLTTRVPYSETWIVYDDMGFSPEQMLRALEPTIAA